MNKVLQIIKRLMVPLRDYISVGIDYLTLDEAKHKLSPEKMQQLLAGAQGSVKHPFILAEAQNFDRASRDYYSKGCDEVTKRSLDYVFACCEQLLDEEKNPPLTYVLEDDDGLLEVSRTVLQRVCALCGAYRISGDGRYARRAVLEMEQVCEFPDWHSEHFLDCAEMAFAISLGCDWLWEYLSESQKRIFCEATWKNAIEPALSPDKLKNWWTWSKTNWNSVCYSAIGTACMLFSQYSPEKAASFLSQAFNRMPAHFCSFTPDGVYAEGSGYWEYGTAYLTYFIKNSRAFFGTDFGLSECAGFDKTGYFPLYITLPSGVFNYGDNKAIACASPILYFFAEEYKSPLPALFENRYNPTDLEDSLRDSMLTALWYSAQLTQGENAQSLPLSVHLRSDLSQELVIMRSSFTDGNAVCAAIKAGNNNINHSDLDIGSFVLDFAGVRWADELGQGNYAAPGYFINVPGGGRWKNYCKRAEGQNTLLVVPCGKKAGDGQYAFAKCRFSEFTAYKNGGGRAVLDMTGAYVMSGVKKAVRSFELSEDLTRLTISDTVECERMSDIYWFMHTKADILINSSGRAAVLTSEGKSIRVTLACGSDGILYSTAATSLDVGKYKYDRELPDFRKLCITAKNTASVSFTVVIDMI